MTGLYAFSLIIEVAATLSALKVVMFGIAICSICRRYMEDGPSSLPEVKHCLPIADQKEPWAVGFYKLQAYTNSWWLTMVPVSILFSLCRWLANLTSKIPMWPADIEDACRVGPHDPFIRDATQDKVITFSTRFQDYDDLFLAEGLVPKEDSLSYLALRRGNSGLQ